MKMEPSAHGVLVKQSLVSRLGSLFLSPSFSLRMHLVCYKTEKSAMLRDVTEPEECLLLLLVYRKRTASFPAGCALSRRLCQSTLRGMCFVGYIIRA